ncbi:glycoside hydrolase family 32 protein [Sanguibacter inulinus]|uniref:beta-fructofuranosidase n=1 Tax=Sanguibacter inulinus TaxID=60922 RepID=A0A853EV02_9MICO|nr:glycoside hydrolase family 32 protein [Sanguibacter inulinus]MBF0721603.1 glycoside hydrolase family 32 protein [Sanguibacter inulinus]NYS92748.1 glycoside hydrolase family 32 protein [Sanguibacter inulinus]
MRPHAPAAAPAPPAPLAPPGLRASAPAPPLQAETGRHDEDHHDTTWSPELSETIALSGADLVTRAESDRHRPRFHFTSPAGWLNDANGVSQRDGVYHLFYQYNPVEARHHRIHWGHATSTDLVTWEDAPIALEPGGPDAPDSDGCWSGVLVDDDGVPTIVYSARRGESESAAIAVGSADLRTWTKDPANPVIAGPPADLDTVAFRDHSVWREDGRWRQLIGSGLRGQGGTALLYESDDLRSWRYVGPLVVGDASDPAPGAPDWTGTMWECVDLFEVPAGRAELPPERGHALVFSAWDEGVTHHPLYLLGRYEGDTFTPAALRRLDYGGRYFYAPQSTTDDHGRRVMFGWLQEGRSDDAAAAAGWSGVMSLPRDVSAGADGELVSAPVREVEALRRDHVVVEPRPGTTVLDPTRVDGRQCDLVLTVTLAPGAWVELAVLVSEESGEQTVVRLDRPQDPDLDLDLVLDRSAASVDPGVDATPRSGPVPHEDGAVTLRVLVDRSALEVFANGRALTARSYPEDPGADGLVLRSSPEAQVSSIDAWSMADIWSGPRELRPR